MSRHVARANVVAVLRTENGQATVELIGIAPALILAGALAWQLVLVGHTAWLAAHAARAAARAQLVGADPRAAARSALPATLERGLEVRSTDRGAVRVRVPVPLVHRGWRAPVKLGASTSLEAVR